MRPCRLRKNRFIAKLVIGFGLITLGAIFALQNLGFFPWGGTIRFWPWVLLFLALASFAKKGILAFNGHLFLLGGVALQLKSLGQGHLLEQWWPAGLIWLGAVMAIRSLCYRRNTLPVSSCQDSCERPS